MKTKRELKKCERKLTKEEIRDWLVENCVHHGVLDLRDLDFSEYEMNVNLSGMLVNGDLVQCDHIVSGDLYQCDQRVKGDLCQAGQIVKGTLTQQKQRVSGDLVQDRQKVRGKLYLQSLENLEEGVGELGIYYKDKSIKRARKIEA